MKEKSYHHGDLKNALIEAGIQLVDKEGMMALSLRKVAASCGVSHAAPYNHFRTKEDLLEAMQEHITVRFTKQLQETLLSHNGQEDLLIELGCTYLRFFMANPHYYSFIFGQMGVSIDFDKLDSYPPFDLFKTAALEQFGREGSNAGDPPDRDPLKSILTMWSVVHGFTGFATMHTIKYSGDWVSLLAQILREHVSP